MTRPRGTPPTPSAASSRIEPVGMASTWTRAESSPSFMIAPLPNWRSICCTASSSAFERSLLLASLADGLVDVFPAMSRIPLICLWRSVPGPVRAGVKFKDVEDELL
jgi:hypothetical protein